MPRYGLPPSKCDLFRARSDNDPFKSWSRSTEETRSVVCGCSKEDEEDEDEEKGGVKEEPLSESLAAAAIVMSLAPCFTGCRSSETGSCTSAFTFSYSNGWPI